MAGAQQSNQPDNSNALLWIIAAVFIAGAVVWYTFKKYLVGVYFTIKLWEINLISMFTHGLDDVRTWILASDPATFSFQDVVKVGQAVGEYLRIPFVIVLFILAFIVFFNNSARTFKRNYTMKDLVESEKTNWPQIMPVANLNLIKTDIDKGPWAMAMTPMQFCKRYNLIDIHQRQSQEALTKKERNKLEAVLRRGMANKIFSIQLGPVWEGTAKLPMHIKALFAAFAARHNSDTKAALDLLDQLSRSSVTQLDFTGVNELCSKHEGSKGIQKIINSHAYVLTIMASMLEASREDGVQASADFLWLKPVDRRLWYMLNTVGRQTPFVEVAGPFAHWIAEKELGAKLAMPMVGEATNALELALKDIIYKPDE